MLRSSNIRARSSRRRYSKHLAWHEFAKGYGKASTSEWADPKLWICLTLGLTTFITFSFGGQLGLSDLLMLALVPFFLPKSLVLMRRTKAVVIQRLAFLYFFGLILTDLIIQTPNEDLIRGWAKVGMLCLVLITVPSLFAGKPNRLIAYTVGFWLASLSQLALGDSPAPYKFYVAVPLTGFSFLLAGKLKSKWGAYAYIFPGMVAAISFLLNARSAAGFAVLTIAIVLLNLRIPKRVQASPRRMQKRAAVVMAVVVITGISIVQLYTWAASSGALGQDAASKYYMQAGHNGDEATPLDVLLGGRTESQFAIPKIAESPIIGHGSWAKDPQFVRMRADEIHIKLDQYITDYGIIPSHSHFFGAWLEAGIFGAIFWGYAAFMVIRVLLYGYYQSAGMFSDVVAYITCVLSWDILFSPFGGEVKVYEAAVLVVLAGFGARGTAALGAVTGEGPTSSRLNFEIRKRVRREPAAL